MENGNFSLQSIFHECHGAINPNEYPLVKDSDSSLFNEYVLELSRDPFLENNLYYNEKGLLNSFFYYKDFLFIEGTFFLFHKENYRQFIEIENKNYENLLFVRDWPFIFIKMEKRISMFKYIEMFDSIPDELKYDSF